MVLISGIQPVSMWIKVSSPISPHDSGTALKMYVHVHTYTHTHTHTQIDEHGLVVSNV